MKNFTSRRNLLISSFKTGLSLAAASVIGPVLFSSCRKNDDNNVVHAREENLAAIDDEALNDQERSIRASLKYVDQTPLSHRTCDNCKLYTLPPKGTNGYGGCKIVPGPIHPKGYCVAWIARM